jgi:hypothetical protein
MNACICFSVQITDIIWYAVNFFPGILIQQCHECALCTAPPHQCKSYMNHDVFMTVKIHNVVSGTKN